MENPKENFIGTLKRQELSKYKVMAEMIELGPYPTSSDKSVKTDMKYISNFDTFPAQNLNERSNLASGHAKLAQIHRERSK